MIANLETSLSAAQQKQRKAHKKHKKHKPTAKQLGTTINNKSTSTKPRTFLERTVTKVIGEMGA